MSSGDPPVYQLRSAKSQDFKMYQLLYFGPNTVLTLAKEEEETFIRHWQAASYRATAFKAGCRQRLSSSTLQSTSQRSNVVIIVIIIVEFLV